MPQFPAQIIGAADWRPGVHRWEYMAVLDRMWAIVAQEVTGERVAQYIELVEHLLALLQPGTTSHAAYVGVLERTRQQQQQQQQLHNENYWFAACMSFAAKAGSQATLWSWR